MPVMNLSLKKYTIEVDLVTLSEDTGTFWVQSQDAPAFLGAGSFCLRIWLHRKDWALKKYNFAYCVPSKKMLKSKSIFYLAITLKTKMINKNHEIWISVEKVITCNLRN